VPVYLLLLSPSPTLLFLLPPPPPSPPLFPYTTLFRSGAVRRDVALALQDLGDRDLQLRVRHRDLVVVGRVRVAQTCEHVRDRIRSEEHTSELQSQSNLVCRLVLEKKKI